jgi:hypothetical protein
MPYKCFHLMSLLSFSHAYSVRHTHAELHVHAWLGDRRLGKATYAACGLLGSCNAGTCSCAADSGMLPTFVANPNTTTRATTPRVPACHYPGETVQTLPKMRLLVSMIMQLTSSFKLSSRHYDRQPNDIK